jgi:hypothetical protein
MMEIIKLYKLKFFYKFEFYQFSKSWLHLNFEVVEVKISEVPLQLFSSYLSMVFSFDMFMIIS